MKTIKSTSTILLIIVLACFGCNGVKKQSAASTPPGAPLDTIVFEPKLPEDVLLLNQSSVNAFMWQSFIALTWPADPTNPGQPDWGKGVSDWGKPGDLTPMTFGTYKSAEEVFTHTAPDPWGSNHKGVMTEHENPDDCQRRIGDMHKFDDEDVIDEIFQASGGRTPWLTDQEGNLIWYEIKLNETEFEYIVKNQFYNPVAQFDSSKFGSGIWLPFGSIELKASWRIIPDDQFEDLKYKYKIIQACVPTEVSFDSKGNPVLEGYKEQKVGLTGLHIIQKTPTAPQFLWATFEHNGLAPTGSKPCSSDVDWLLYNPDKCDDPVNVSPNYKTQSVSDPIQVIKEEIARTADDAVMLNEYMMEQIAEVSPNSVFANYHLVDSQWPSSAVADSDNRSFTPLQDGGKTPAVLTNVTMETYVQGISCLTCHVNAGIDSLTVDSKEYASDYSFAFQLAKKQK